MTTKTATAQSAAKITVQCQECGKRWKVSPAATTTQCPKCNSVDVDVAVDQPAAAAQAVKITANELDVLRAFTLQDHLDGAHPVGAEVWVNCITDKTEQVKSKRLAAVMGSLYRKGLIVENGNGATCSLTQAGFDLLPLDIRARHTPELTIDEARALDSLTVAGPDRYPAEDEAQVTPEETFAVNPGIKVSEELVDELLRRDAQAAQEWIESQGTGAVEVVTVDDEVLQADPVELGEREQALLRRLYAGQEGVTVTRKSDREFDLVVTGPGFRAWLPLAAIHEMDWTSARIAGLTDYPEMAAAGDWSGVRDSSKDAKWAIFETEINAFLGAAAGRKDPRRASARNVEARTETAVAPKRVAAKATKPAAKALAKKAAVTKKAQPAASPKGRALVLGLPAAPLGRWMGSQGWTVEQAATVLGKFGVTMGERSLFNLLSEGRNAAKRAAAGIKEAVAVPDRKTAKELEAARPFAQ